MFIVIISSLIISAAADKPICDRNDTTTLGKDTIVIKYRCHPNGKQSKIYQYKNGKNYGPYEEWASNGQKIADLKYVDDELDGLVQEWDSLGNVKTYGNYIKGKPIGHHKVFYSANRLESSLNYNDYGKKHGLCETWREDGTRIDSIVCNNGDYEEIRAYYANGKLRYHATYSGTATLQEIFHDGSIFKENYPNCVSAEFYSISSSMPIAKIVNGTGTSIWCDSIGNNCDTVQYMYGVPVPENCSPHPKKKCKKIFPGKDKCWFKVIKSRLE